MDKMFVHFNGTKAQFIEKGYPSVYTNSIVFIKGGTDIKSSCIYTHGTYFANFAEFLAAINYVKGISVNGQNYNAATGGGYVAFSASDPTIVDVDINEKGVIIGLSEDFINTIGNSNESADAQGSLFARIKNLAEIVGQLTGVDGDELVSIEGQISSAVNSLKKEILGTLDSTDSKTLEAINDELNTLGSKYNKLSINGKAFKDAANSAIVLTGEDINLGGDSDYSEGSIAGAFNDLNTKCTDVYDEVEELLNSISNLEAAINTHNKEVRFFCIEPVVVKVGEVEHQCAANEVATVFVGDEDFEIIPTSNESIQTLLAYPKPLTWYDWLEGVDSFSGIIFDMNELDTYKHWIQYYQDEYHVQKAQYSNCIFWSDKPYTHSPFEGRTNYTLYYSAELPLCYSRIPENTYKPFYLAYGVKTDPNWNNQDYINSYSNVSGATQTFSYYGMSSIGIFDMSVHPIKLPKDCRGLMYHAPAIQHAGVFDAINTTNFGAKKGSWQDAFGDCISLTSLYIQNLKASINLSWSPINTKSIAFIVNNAANTSAITISVSPYTWYRLTDEIKTAARDKNITIALLTGNYQDDSRWNTKQDKVEGKGLSTEDFTTELKSKLSGLSNYDDTQINQAVESLQTQLNTLVSGNVSTAIESFNEIIAFLDGIEDSQSLDSIVASIEQQIASKVESDSLATVATSGSYNDLSDKPTIPAEQVNADWNATSGKAQILNKPTIPSAVTESTISDWGFTKNVGTVTEDELVWIKSEGEAGVCLKGTNGTATGNLAISAGDDKTASDGTAFPSVASGDHAVVFGFGNTCAGRSTLAQGLYNTVNGKDSVAFGQRNLVGGDQAFAAGQQNEVSARLGVAIGYQNKATNTDSIAIGYKNTSSGSASVAMGDTCESSGTSSTAMGYKTKASGAYSATFGENTQATNEGEVAMGTYNKSTTSTDASEQTMFSFGIGTSDTNRANALEIKKNGDVYIGDKLLTGNGITEADIAAMGFTKNEGTYSKPSDGIPKTDLSSDVQTSLGKADTALQSYTEQYTGTVKGININGTTEYPNPGGIVYLEDIGGGNTGYPIVRERTDFLSPNMVYNLYVEPNTYHILTKSQEFAHEIKINLNSYDIFNTEEYVIELVGFEDIDTITMPSGVIWADVKSPSIIEGATIIMSIVNGKGVWAKF